MGAPGQKSVLISFKVNMGLKARIDAEREYVGGTQAEFLNDAVKFYVEHLQSKSIALWQMDNPGVEPSELPDSKTAGRV